MTAIAVVAARVVVVFLLLLVLFSCSCLCICFLAFACVVVFSLLWSFISLVYGEYNLQSEEYIYLYYHAYNLFCMSRMDLAHINPIIFSSARNANIYICIIVQKDNYYSQS